MKDERFKALDMMKEKIRMQDVEAKIVGGIRGKEATSHCSS